MGILDCDEMKTIRIEIIYNYSMKYNELNVKYNRYLPTERTVYRKSYQAVPTYYKLVYLLSILKFDYFSSSKANEKQ